MNLLGLKSGNSCLVTFSNEGVEERQALLFSDNPLKSKSGDYIWVLLDDEPPACYKVRTLGTAAAKTEVSNITVSGKTQRTAIGIYTTAKRRDFEKQKLRTQSATSGMLLLIGTWISASLGTLNAAKVYETGWHFDRVTPFTWALVGLSLVLAVLAWLREYLSK